MSKEDEPKEKVWMDLFAERLDWEFLDEFESTLGGALASVGRGDISPEALRSILRGIDKAEVLYMDYDVFDLRRVPKEHYVPFVRAFTVQLIFRGMAQGILWEGLETAGYLKVVDPGLGKDWSQMFPKEPHFETNLLGRLQACLWTRVQPAQGWKVVTALDDPELSDILHGAEKVLGKPKKGRPVPTRRELAWMTAVPMRVMGGRSKAFDEFQLRMERLEKEEDLKKKTDIPDATREAILKQLIRPVRVLLFESMMNLPVIVNLVLTAAGIHDALLSGINHGRPALVQKGKGPEAAFELDRARTGEPWTRWVLG